MRGLAKLWNTIVIHSKNDLLLILNDDVEIHDGDVFANLEATNIDEFDSIIRINNSFSHFVVTKQILEKLKYFDERFLGFGFEDGDMIYRHIEALNIDLETRTWYIPGVKSLISMTCDDNVQKYSGSKYSQCNEQFLRGSMGPKYKVTDNPTIITTFNPRLIKIMDDLDQYPYETFFRKNKDKL